MVQQAIYARGMTKVGVVFPQLEIGRDPGAIREYATAVEDMGFHHILAYDHVLGADTDRDDVNMLKWPPGHYTYREQFHEPLILFAYLAGLTRTVELVTGVLVLPQRQTALVAKQAVEIQLLSNNRLRLGVGVGYNHLEFQALDVSFEGRGRRIEEQIGVLRELCSKQLVTMHGDYHRLDRVGLNPLPDSPIPIWMGATSPAGFRRVAAMADGWICPGGALSPMVRHWLDQLDRALSGARSPSPSFGIDGRLDVRFRPDEEVMREMALWQKIGATHVSVNTMAPYDRRSETLSVDGHIGLLQHTRELIELS